MLKSRKYWKRKIKNTQRATQGALRQLAEFLAIKQLPELKDIGDDELPEILFDFYCEMKPQKEDKYATQSMKCKRTALNRHFKAERSLDIIKNSMFIHTNEMLKGVLVNAKKSGKGVKHSYPKMSPSDLHKISLYFDVDHMNNPNPKVLTVLCDLFLLSVWKRKSLPKAQRHIQDCCGT